MKKLFLPVEWKISFCEAIWHLKSKDKYIGLMSIVIYQGKYFNSHGKMLLDDNDILIGYDTLEQAKKAVEKYFNIKYVDIRINNLEVPNA